MHSCLNSFHQVTVSSFRKETKDGCVQENVVRLDEYVHFILRLFLKLGERICWIGSRSIVELGCYFDVDISGKYFKLYS